MDDRRYGDDEVREIFERASVDRESGSTSVSGTDGLSLDELKRIGGQAGLSPESVERAALSLQHPTADRNQERVFGAPASVGTSVDLQRTLTDREWEVLVGELRRTFRAKGSQESFGESRQWTNGNLHVFIEPSGSGYRMRLGTRRGDLAPLMAMSTTLTGLGLFLLWVLAIKGGATSKLAFPAGLMGAGAFMFVGNLVRLFPWARRRERQFEEIIESTQRMIASGEG